MYIIILNYIIIQYSLGFSLKEKYVSIYNNKYYILSLAGVKFYYFILCILISTNKTISY